MVEVAAGVRFERMRWWHIDEVLPIEVALFGPEQWSAAMFWNELGNGHHYLVALADGASGEGVVGYAGLSVDERDGWIHNIAVSTAWQRRSIGRALLEHLLDEAWRRQAQAVFLEVAVDNGPAQRLYDRYGFEVVGRRPGYYQPSNTDALVMRRVRKDCDGVVEGNAS